MKKIVFLIALISMSSCFAQKTKTEDKKKKKDLALQMAFPKEYVGHYKGNLNVSDASGTIQNVPMELTIAATEDKNKYEYTMAYVVGQKKDERKYTLIAIDKENGIYNLDENNGIILSANYIRQTLISTFEVNNKILNSRVQFTNSGKIYFSITVAERKQSKLTGDKEQPVISYQTTILQKAALQKVDED